MLTSTSSLRELNSDGVFYRLRRDKRAVLRSGSALVIQECLVCAHGRHRENFQGVASILAKIQLFSFLHKKEKNVNFCTFCKTKLKAFNATELQKLDFSRAEDKNNKFQLFFDVSI